jgi:hypothetical protein
MLMIDWHDFTLIRSFAFRVWKHAINLMIHNSPCQFSQIECALEAFKDQAYKSYGDHDFDFSRRGLSLNYKGLIQIGMISHALSLLRLGSFGLLRCRAINWFTLIHLILHRHMRLYVHQKVASKYCVQAFFRWFPCNGTAKQPWNPSFTLIAKLKIELFENRFRLCRSGPPPCGLNQ